MLIEAFGKKGGLMAIFAFNETAHRLCLRHAMLSPALLELQRAWWREGQAKRRMLPGGWLFPGQNPVNPLSTRQ